MKFFEFFDKPIYLCKSTCQQDVELIVLHDNFVYFCSIYQYDVRFAC